jgi:hypothetical protein
VLCPIASLGLLLAYPENITQQVRGDILERFDVLEIEVVHELLRNLESTL